MVNNLNIMKVASFILMHFIEMENLTESKRFMMNKAG